jgi:long-subunit fatty acid transport protein
LNSLSGDNDFFAGGYSLDIIHLGMAVRENDYISLSFRNRFSAAGSLPRDLAELVLDNPYDKYKTFDISSTFKFIMWNELGLSYSYKFNDNWQLGGRLKYLSGVINAETEKLSYTIDKYYDYYLLSSDVNLRSNVGSSSSSSNNDWFDPVDFNPIGYFFSNNFSDAGIGIDVGAKYQTTDKRLTANASISDLGMIFWNERNSINTITLNPNNKLKFEGFGDLEQTFNSGADFTTLFDSVGTEFKRTIGIAEVEDYSYSSSLPTLFQASGTYSIDDKFTHNVSLGFAGRLVMSDKFHYAISAGYHWFSDSKRWQLLANYT